MKKFLIGFLAAILICTLAVGALAATGKLSIEVNTDMKIRVNGEVFAPTDANGNPVMVFEYNGTTYAPLRALAEAYGLEVGYDAASRMATVDEPNTRHIEWSEDEETAYKQFKSMWKYNNHQDVNNGNFRATYTYNGDLNMIELKSSLEDLLDDRYDRFFSRHAEEVYQLIGEEKLSIEYGISGDSVPYGYKVVELRSRIAPGDWKSHLSLFNPELH